MAVTEQIGLLEVFQTPRPSNPLFCHQDFLEKLSEHSRDAIGRRVTLLMQRLAVDARRQHYKATQGVNRGWRRSRLGGNHGSHFYAWWAPKSAVPLKESGDFETAPEDALFLRDIRHHDDHSELTPQSLTNHYLPVSVFDLRREEYGPAPWTQTQARFASARQPVRILKGHPGSGKTTALWHAADATGAERVLYITYSRELAGLARDYFDRYCSAEKKFDVVVFPNLIRQLLGSDAPVLAERDLRRRFAHDLAPFARTMGPWTNSQTALYDELHAHLIGDALPESVGRFRASKLPRVADDAYRERRARVIGPAAAVAALESANRLERLDSSSFADRYCPELSLAWLAADRLGSQKVPAALLAVDCIAVDECQDLTPIEAFVLVRLAHRINSDRRVPVTFLLAGDEAQTVRPTDFEWGWLNDLLHAQVGSPSEHKLSANLRSPRRIAEMVNRVWDLYSHLQKQERPSGSGYAEIDDDATDQVLYCTAAPGPDFDELLNALTAREGLAVISLEEAVPSFVTEPARAAVLTVAEAKGLDFHSVCVLDAGRHIERVTKEQTRQRFDSDIENLRQRLAIDQLRVALSRPTERLIWLDVSPSDSVVRQSIEFLNGGNSENGVSSCVPSALLKTLEEEQLDVEERIQRCQTDARQYLQVKPEMAWSRAQQAVALLGRPGSPAAVTDEAVRNTAYLTLAEICFTLGFRNARLAPELGRPDLFGEARRACISANRFGLGAIISVVERVHRALPQDRLQPLADLAQALPKNRDQIEPWLLLEIAPKAIAWIDELERALSSPTNAAVLTGLLPPLYEVLDIPDRANRLEKLQQRAIQLLIKGKLFAQALPLIQALPVPQPTLEAACHEGLGNFREAAECYRTAGTLKEALQAYRSIPDFAAALDLVRELGDHPAAESLEWISRMQKLIAERPEKFTKTVTSAEKKLLEELLEQSLGVSRKVAAKKTATRKTVAKKPAGPTTRKRTPPF